MGRGEEPTKKETLFWQCIRTVSGTATAAVKVRGFRDGLDSAEWNGSSGELIIDHCPMGWPVCPDQAPIAEGSSVA